MQASMPTAQPGCFSTRRQQLHAGLQRHHPTVCPSPALPAVSGPEMAEALTPDVLKILVSCLARWREGGATQHVRCTRGTSVCGIQSALL